LQVTGSIYTSALTGSLNGSNLVNASVANAKLTNSTISGIALGSNLATLTIGTGLSGTSYNGSTGITIANTGVTSNVAGTGISINQGTGAVTITNSGVTSIVAGTGISINQGTGAVTVTNTITNNNQLTNGAGYITSAGNAATATSVTGTSTISGKLTINNGTSNALQINTTVADTTTRDAIYLFEGDGQATGRQAISWYNNNQSYYKARLWTEVGSSYQATQFGIDVADDARNLGTRMYIRNGNSFFSGDVTAYASDARLKENIRPIKNALSRIKNINGIFYDWKDTVSELGFTPSSKSDVGVLAQEVQSVLPEVVKPAPFDYVSGISKSGENYLTVQYEKIVPLLIEAIKEQQTQIEELKTIINALTK